MVLRSISIYCPFCHQHTSVEPARVRVDQRYDEFYVDAVWEESEDDRWWIGVCNYCHSPVLVKNDADTIYPQPLPAPTDTNVPEDIRADLDEAKQCFAVSAWRGAAVMARRAMQSAAINKGATKNKLADQILELATQSKITSDLKEWADVVRWVGNDAAHPGGEQVTGEDAEEVLKLAEQFLHVLYVTPALANKLRARKGK